VGGDAGDGGAGLGEQGPGGFDALGSHDGRSAADAAAGAGGLEPGDGPFPDELPFEVGQRAEDREDEAPAGGGGVDGLGQGPEAHSPALELVDRGEQVRQGPAEPVQPPDDEGVAGQQPLEELGQLGSVVAGAGGDVGPQPGAAGGDQRVVLERCVLRGRRDPGVAVSVRHAPTVPETTFRRLWHVEVSATTFGTPTFGVSPDLQPLARIAQQTKDLGAATVLHDSVVQPSTETPSSDPDAVVSADPGVGEVWVYLDESGTHAGAMTLLVGAIATANRGGLEQQVIEAYEEVLANPSHWSDEAKRTRFAAQGFHHAEDNESVRAYFADRMQSMNFRAHIAYWRGVPAKDSLDGLIAMYSSMLKGVVGRYATSPLNFVFEQEERLNGLFASLVEDASSGSQRDPLAGAPVAYVGTKQDPALSVVDYILALAAHQFDDQTKPFQRQRFAVLAGHVARMYDYGRLAK